MNMNIKHDDNYQCSDWVAGPSVRIDSSTEYCEEEEEEEEEGEWWDMVMLVRRIGRR